MLTDPHDGFDPERVKELETMTSITSGENMTGDQRDPMLLKFLRLVPSANWREPPRVWNEQLRRALSDGLVTVGWGGVLKLTDAGCEELNDA